jgi:hypothetical protein
METLGKEIIVEDNDTHVSVPLMNRGRRRLLCTFSKVI